MTILEDIYLDVVATLAMDGGDSNRSLCANELRAIRNRLEPIMSRSVIEEAGRRSQLFADMRKRA